MALFLGCVTLVFILLWLQLGSLVPGFSQNELTQRAASSTAKAIVDNPMGAPHKILQLGAHYTKHIGPGAMRSASALIGLVVAGSFYYVLKSWYSRRVAVLGALLFVTSAWFLHSARLGTDGILYALLITALATTLWLQRSRGSAFAVVAGAAVVVGLFYIPGMIWFIVPAILWQSKRIGRLLEDIPFGFLVLIILGVLAMLGPIGWAIYQDPSLAKTFFGLPQTFPAPLDILKNIARVPLQIFFRGPTNPEFWLDRLPLLDWFAAAMFVIGAYAYVLRYKLDRTWLFIYIFVVGSVLIGLKGPVSTALLLPFAYVLVTSGVGLMFGQWFTVFPRNPVARSIGTGLLVVAVALSCLYNTTHYFVAWPDAPATKQTFIHQP
jgi:hypothetical protein